MDAETSSGTYTPFASSQTAVPELEPPFRLTLARVPGRMVPTSMTSWFKTAGAGGIGSMRLAMRNWKS